MAENVDAGSVLFSLTDETREMVDETRARELVEAALGGRDPASITKVRLSNKSYSPGAAAVIGEALKEMTSVTEVDFSDIIAGRPKEEGLQVLAAVCGGVAERERLSYVDVSENAMGPDGVEACRPAIEGKKELEALFMCNDGLSEAAMEAVRDILLSSTPTSLRRLHFFNNMSGDGGARALAEVLPHCPKLSDFRFSGTRSGRLGSAAVVNALVKCPAVSAGLLERLDLADNTLGGDGAEALAEVLCSQPALTHVNLRDCELEDEGSDAIAEVLSGTAPLLKELDFSGNELTCGGAESVASCAAGKPHLEYLGLEDNEIDSEGAKAVARALASTPCIRKILLNSNEIGSSGALAVARNVRDKEHLESLEVNGNALSEEGLTRLHRILESAGKLDVLGDMDDNDPDGDEDDEDEKEVDEDEEGVDERAAETTTPAPRDGEMDELSAALGAVKV